MTKLFFLAGSSALSWPPEGLVHRCLSAGQYQNITALSALPPVTLCCMPEPCRAVQSTEHHRLALVCEAKPVLQYQTDV